LEHNEKFIETYEEIVQKTDEDSRKTVQGFSLFAISIIPSVVVINPPVFVAVGLVMTFVSVILI
jgi:hypothetical protein